MYLAPLHWVRLQLDNKVKNPMECIMYTPEYKYGAHAHPTMTPLLTKDSISCSVVLRDDRSHMGRIDDVEREHFIHFSW